MQRITQRLAFFSSIRQRIMKQRETRLGKINMEKILPTTTAEELQKIRNIGIIAHIDAGKTTTTERMLYYAGALPSPGGTDTGTTTMDFMEQERKRGITIRSAAISFNWKSHQVNLIDTPGHVDFSGQVARSLRVLDGVVTIMDGVKGVEAQTIKVWEEATKRDIPKLCYINKMDRIGASVLNTAQALKEQLNVQPLIMQQQVDNAHGFNGIIDIVSMKELQFNGMFGEEIQERKIDNQDKRFSQLTKSRNELAELIANYDEEIADLYLAEKSIPAYSIKAALRRILNNPISRHRICPIFIGSSFRNKGVQLLLDAVIDYLPSPSEKGPIKCVINPKRQRLPLKSEQLTCYVFKTVFDIEKGLLAYLRVYSGELKIAMILANCSTEETLKVTKIYRVRANQFITVREAGAGDIVAIEGIRVNSGDTLIEQKTKKFVMQKLQLPTPIFTVPFVLESAKYEKPFEKMISQAIIEDTSLSYKHSQDTDQHLVSGLGELHLQILRDRMIAYGVKVSLGKLKIQFKQTIFEAAKTKLDFKLKTKKGKEEGFYLKIKLKPLQSDKDIKNRNNKVTLGFDKVQEFDKCWNQFMLRKEINMSKRSKKNVEDEDEDSVQQKPKINPKQSARNPTPIISLDKLDLLKEDMDQDEQEDEEYQEQDINEEEGEEEGEEEEEQEQEQEQGQEQEQNQEEQDEYNQDNEQQIQEKRGHKKQDILENEYHISTLPFETLRELCQTCMVQLISGKYNYPVINTQIIIINGVYKKRTFTKAAMNRCASKLIRTLVQQNCKLIEPMFEVQLVGEESMISLIVKDILKKRGRIDEQTYSKGSSKVRAIIPAASVKGWAKEIRTMGLQIDMKFARYEEVTGIDPKVLVQENEF